MITPNRTYCKLEFQFDLNNDPPLATIDTEYGWTLFMGDDAIAIYEFITKYVDIDPGLEPPDEAI